MQRRPTCRPIARQAAACIALVSSCALAFADPAAKPDTTIPDVSVSQSAISAPLSPEAQALREYLNFDPARSMTMMPATPRGSSRAISARDLDWNRTDKSDGSSAVSVKSQLPTTWDYNVDAKVGADFGLASGTGSSYQQERPLPYSKDQNSGAAWANVTVPGFASIDARVDPTKDQGKVGTTFSRSVPVGKDYSVTLLNSYALTEQIGRTPNSSPITGVGTPPSPNQVWSTDRLVKFSILSTGTTLAAGTTSSTLDNVTRNKIIAEQKLFDALSVTTAVTDVGGQNSKSISAGFKWKW